MTRPEPDADLWTLVVPAADAEVAADALWSAGAAAVVVEDLGDAVRLLGDVTPGDVPPGWELTRTRADAVPAPPPLPPVTVGPWTIHRPEHDVPATCAVIVDPSGAFGSGHHPTTRMTLEALARLVEPGTTMLDVGCGSGVLSLCAAVSGTSCVAVDIDPDATALTRTNARRNGVESRIRTLTGTVAAVRGSFDVVAANIGLGSIEQSASDLRDAVAPGGTLVISGVLDTQVSPVSAAVGLVPVSCADDGDWAALVYRR